VERTLQRELLSSWILVCGQIYPWTFVADDRGNSSRYIIGAGMNRDAQTEEAVKRLVAFFAPERVYLFGSTARGEDRPDSDLIF
jgi:hypothetical protein